MGNPSSSGVGNDKDGADYPLVSAIAGAQALDAEMFVPRLPLGTR